MLKESSVEGVEFVAASDGIREYRMANGMKLLLAENRVAPVVTFLVLYKVGSRNEAVGHTGATHLLEHMLFKGTPTFNKASNTQIAATLQKIGADYNATTWYDRTNYFETVPSDKLELAVRLEADRMRNSFIADEDRQSEMTVVRNELERGQNEPVMVLDEAVYATAFREHPYHHPTIGWRADVENVPTARLKEFYDTFYHPNNATAIAVGDFDRNEALSLISRYFGEHLAAPHAIPEVYTDEPAQEGERRIVVRRAGELPLVQVSYHAPAALGQTSVLSNAQLAERAASPPERNDIFPLVVLASALAGGVTSRLYQALVETELAVDADVRVDQFRDPGLFSLYVTATPGTSPAHVEEVIYDELERLSKEGVDAAEVEKAKRQIVARVAYERDGTQNVAMQISEAEAVADWRFYVDYAANVSRVTPEDVARVAREYLTEDNRTVGHFVPKRSGGGNGGAVDVESASSVKRLRAVPHGWRHYRDPEDGETQGEDERGGGDDDSRRADESRGESNRMPESRAVIEQRHSDKSSDAVSAVTPESAGRSDFASRVSRTKLDTGATLLVLESRATPTVALRGSLRAGSYFEPRDRPGLARLTAEMLERGTLRRGKLELAGRLESAGAELAFNADPFAVNLSGRALAEDFPLLLETLAEMLREPSFPAEELEKLKQQTIAAVREQQTDTRARAYERLTQAIYDETNPFRLPTGERLIESIASVTVEDVRGFYEKFYGGRSLILSVVGDVEAARVGEQFEKLFSTFAGPEDVEVRVEDPAPQEGTRRESVLLQDKANVDVMLGSAAPLRRDTEDYYAAVLANSALGESTLSSRLGLQVRDVEGLTYGISSRFRAPGLAAGPWYVGVSVNPGNAERAIASALQVLRDYVENGIRPDELEDEKSSAIGSFKVSLSTNAGLASALWNAEFYSLGADYVDRFPNLIQAVTLEQVNAAIRKYFKPDHLTVVLAGDVQAAPAETATPVP